MLVQQLKTKGFEFPDSNDIRNIETRVPEEFLKQYELLNSIKGDLNRLNELIDLGDVQLVVEKASFAEIELTLREMLHI